MFEDRNDKRYVRAVQGHSADLHINYEADMVKLTFQNARDNKIQQVVHGTQLKHLQDIVEHGLICGGLNRSRSQRVHIHFAVSVPIPGRSLSGIRSGSNVAIYVNVEQAMKAGVDFYLSKNNVVLTRGKPNHKGDGVVSTAFFTKIVHLVTKAVLWENGHWKDAARVLFGPLP